MQMSKDYTTVKFGPLKGVLVRAGSDWRCYGVSYFPEVFKKVCEAVEIKLAYTTVRSGLAIIAPVWCANQ